MSCTAMAGGISYSEWLRRILPTYPSFRKIKSLTDMTYIFMFDETMPHELDFQRCSPMQLAWDPAMCLMLFMSVAVLSMRYSTR